MPTYVAFLRAINLGATRRFPKDSLVAAVESTGATGVATHLTSGNVRLTSPLRSTARVESALERAFRSDRGFDVPTFVCTQAELVAVAAEADELAGGLVEGAMQYVSVLKAEPPAAAAASFEALGHAGERAWVRGRFVHIALDRPDSYHRSVTTNALVEKLLGPATNRKATVIRELARRWG